MASAAPGETMSMTTREPGPGSREPGHRGPVVPANLSPTPQLPLAVCTARRDPILL